MKAILFIALLIALPLSSQAQDFMSQFIKWDLRVEKIDESHANLVFNARLVPEYHIFSLKHDPMAADGTGIVPEFKFKPSKDFKTVGKPIEVGAPLVQKDELGTSLYFENKAVFKQKIEILSNTPFKASCELYFQLCNHEGCLPPFDYTANFQVSGYSGSNATIDETDTTASTQTTASDTSNAPSSVDQARSPI